MYYCIHISQGLYNLETSNLSWNYLKLSGKALSSQHSNFTFLVILSGARDAEITHFTFNLHKTLYKIYFTLRHWDTVGWLDCWLDVSPCFSQSWFSMLPETLMNDIEFSDSFLCLNCFNRLQVTYKYPLTGWKKAVVCVCVIMLCPHVHATPALFCICVIGINSRT